MNAGALHEFLIERARFLVGDWEAAGTGERRHVEERLEVHIVLKGMFILADHKSWKSKVLEHARVVLIGADEEHGGIAGWWFSSDGFAEVMRLLPDTEGLVFASADPAAPVRVRRSFLPDGAKGLVLRVELAEGAEALQAVQETHFRRRVAGRDPSGVFSAITGF